MQKNIFNSLTISFITLCFHAHNVAMEELNTPPLSPEIIQLPYPPTPKDKEPLINQINSAIIDESADDKSPKPYPRNSEKNEIPTSEDDGKENNDHDPENQPTEWLSAQITTASESLAGIAYLVARNWTLFILRNIKNHADIFLD